MGRQTGNNTRGRTMIRYYFFGLIKYISEHKEIQAGLIIIGGILALVFVPLLVGSISSWLFFGAVKAEMLWIFGFLMSILSGTVIFLVVGLIYVSYLAVLEKLEQRGQ